MSKTLNKKELIVKVKALDGHNYEMGTMILTPEIAEMLLKNMGVQRNIKPKTVDYYANSMTQSKWDDYVSDPLLFDAEEKLINGQHRCKAVIKSGISIGCFVIKGIRKDGYFVIDDVESRSLSDVLGMLDFTHSKILAPSVNLLYQFSVSNPSYSNTLRIDNRTMYQFLKKHPSLPSTVTRTISRYNNMPIKICPISGIAYLAYIIEHINLEIACGFLQVLFNERSPKPEEGCPISLMVKRLQDACMRKDRGLRMSGREKLANLIKAWNLYVVDKRVNHSRYIVWRLDESWPDFQDEDGKVVEYDDINFKVKA